MEPVLTTDFTSGTPGVGPTPLGLDYGPTSRSNVGRSIFELQTDFTSGTPGVGPTPLGLDYGPTPRSNVETGELLLLVFGGILFVIVPSIICACGYETNWRWCRRRWCRRRIAVDDLETALRQVHSVPVRQPSPPSIRSHTESAPPQYFPTPVTRSFWEPPVPGTAGYLVGPQRPRVHRITRNAVSPLPKSEQPPLAGRCSPYYCMPATISGQSVPLPDVGATSRPGSKQEHSPTLPDIGEWV